MLGFPQPDEDYREEDTIHGRTNGPHSSRCRRHSHREGRSTTWSLEEIDLSMEAPVWPNGGCGCAGAASGKEPSQKGLGGTGSRGRSDEGIAGKKVVSPRARRQVAQAAWLCSTPGSGLSYFSRIIQQDARLAQALRGVGKRYPHWGYRLAGSFLQGRGWPVNLKRVVATGPRTPEPKAPENIPYGRHCSAKGQEPTRCLELGFRPRHLWPGEPFRCLTVKDEATRFYLAIAVGCFLTHHHVIEVLRPFMARMDARGICAVTTGQNSSPTT